MILNILNAQYRQIYRDQKISGRAGGNRERRVMDNGYWVSFQGDENVKLDSSDSCTTFNILKKSLTCVL